MAQMVSLCNGEGKIQKLPVEPLSLTTLRRTLNDQNLSVGFFGNPRSEVWSTTAFIISSFLQ